MRSKRFWGGDRCQRRARVVEHPQVRRRSGCFSLCRHRFGNAPPAGSINVQRRSKLERAELSEGSSVALILVSDHNLLENFGSIAKIMNFLRHTAVLFMFSFAVV